MEFFSVNLKYLREQRKMTQAELSADSGFSRTSWNNYENSLSTPNLGDFVKIAKYFDISETDLLHVDLSKGNLTAPKTGKEKGNVKGNPLGNLNTGNSTKKASNIEAGSLQELEELMNAGLTNQQAINTRILGILKGFTSSN